MNSGNRANGSAEFLIESIKDEFPKVLAKAREAQESSGSRVYASPGQDSARWLAHANDLLKMWAYVLLVEAQAAPAKLYGYANKVTMTGDDAMGNRAAPLEQRCPGCGEWHVLAGGLCSECNRERIEEAQDA